MRPEETIVENIDPWQGITPPGQAASISSRRVDPKIKWDVFWAVDADRNRLLVLGHGGGIVSKAKLPRLRGLAIERWHVESGDRAYFTLKLLDAELNDIFHRLCCDVIEAVRAASDESDAVWSLIARTWRWHRMLKGGGPGLLSSEEQKGLLGELSFLQRCLLPVMQPLDVVRSWTGPLASPKDFEIGHLAVECKARRGANRPHIAISNEHQLDTSGVDCLFLDIVEIVRASSDNADGVTLSEFTGALWEDLESKDPSSLELFEERLAMVGFDWSDDYSDDRWLLGPERCFEVTESFPRVVSTDLKSGVENVRYSIALHHCVDFQVDAHVMMTRIREETQNDQH